MNFCEECDNLNEYVQDPETLEMKLKCQKCGHASEIDPSKPIYAKRYVSSTQDRPTRPDLVLDNTLSRTSSIDCLNPNCPTRQPGATQRPEIVTFQYNKETRKLAYICTECREFWKNR